MYFEEKGNGDVGPRQDRVALLASSCDLLPREPTYLDMELWFASFQNMNKHERNVPKTRKGLRSEKSKTNN